MSDPLLRSRRPASARRRRNPLAALIVLAVVPALVLWGLYRWSSAALAAGESAAPRDDPNVLEGQVPPPALSTGLLSMRRTAPALSVELNAEQFKAALVPLEREINELSCLDVKINGRPVGEINPDVPTIPASNQKLLVAAVAEDVLGDDFVFKTKVVGYDPVDQTINGDIFLVGGGDPLLAGDWYESADFDAERQINSTSLDDLAQLLIDAGVNQITGSVVGDGSRYDAETSVPEWADGVAGVDGGPYGALMANDSRVKDVSGKNADPSLAAAQEFTRILKEKGVTISGTPRTGPAGDEFNLLASIESTQLPGVIQELLTTSDNNTAELLVKEIGFASSGNGTRKAGLDAIQATMKRWGIDVEGMVLNDGSGLSAANRVTCTQLVELLERTGPESSVGRGLAVAGETGTLASTFADTKLAGRLIGKTGTLYNPPTNEDPPATKALSGFLPADGDLIVYSMVLNGPTIAEQGEYRPIWQKFANAMVSYPAVANAEALGPR